MRNRNIILAFFILLGISVSAWANETENSNLDEIVNRVQAKYEKINDFHAEFVQESTVRALNKVQEAQGEVWFEKPGKMKWSYYEPAKQEYVSDGNTLWFYNHEEKQLVESTLQEVTNTNTTTTFLSGLGNLKEHFNASFSDGNFTDGDGYYLIDLTPKEDDEGYNKVTIAVDKEDMIVENFYLYDPFGNLTKVRLRDIQINEGIPDSLFTLKVPKGTEVIKVPQSLNQ